MATQPSSINISIFDQTFQIKCPEDKVRELQECARLIDHKMREASTTSKIVGLDKLAIMTMLNMTHELLQEKKQKELYIEALCDRIRKLEHELEMSLTHSSHSTL